MTVASQWISLTRSANANQKSRNEDRSKTQAKSQKFQQQAPIWRLAGNEDFSMMLCRREQQQRVYAQRSMTVGNHRWALVPRSGCLRLQELGRDGLGSVSHAILGTLVPVGRHVDGQLAAEGSDCMAAVLRDRCERICERKSPPLQADGMLLTWSFASFGSEVNFLVPVRPRSHEHV